MLTKQGQASFGILQHQAIPKVAAVYAAQHAVVAPPRGAQNLTQVGPTALYRVHGSHGSHGANCLCLINDDWKRALANRLCVTTSFKNKRLAFLSKRLPCFNSFEIL